MTEANTRWTNDSRLGRVRRCRQCALDAQKKSNMKIRPPKDDPYETRRGSKSVLAKITEQDVVDIRRAHLSGESRQVIAIRYGVTSQNITAIIKRRTWKHIP